MEDIAKMRLYSTEEKYSKLSEDDLLSSNEDVETVEDEDDVYNHSNQNWEADGDVDMPGFGSMTWNQFVGLTPADMEVIFFKTVADAYKFYSYFGFIKGFSVRTNRKDRSKVDPDLIVSATWVCSREGFHLPEDCDDDINYEDELDDEVQVVAGKKRPTTKRGYRYTRCGCMAKMVISYSKDDSVYWVREFQVVHNHELALPDEVQFLRSHRHVNVSDIIQVEALKGLLVHTSRAYEYLVYQKGGYSINCFSLKDLYNAILRKRNVETGGASDVRSVITWTNMKLVQDREFYMRRSVDEEGRLANLYWRDGTSLLDYVAFGDVLIMDSTYKTNRYSRPLVVFAGANNHRATVVFGFGLLVNEKEESYKWLMEQFLDSMKQKQPLSILTDGDEAMRNALAQLCPTARLRLYSWHIAQNIIVNIKDATLTQELAKLISMSTTVDDWENRWAKLVADHGLQNHRWIQSLYEKRERWAEAFFVGQFYAGMCSTQRCESVNSALKKKIVRWHHFSHVLPLLDKMVGSFRNRYLRYNFRAKSTVRRFSSHMKQLEEGAWQVFTDDIFLMIRRQIEFEPMYFVRGEVNFGDDGALLFHVHHSSIDNHYWSVSVTNSPANDRIYICSCKLFESDGIPCPHIFCVLKVLKVKTYPSSLICHRWTQRAATVLCPNSKADLADKFGQMARYSAMVAAVNKACYNFSLNSEGFCTGMEDIQKLVDKSLCFNKCKSEDVPLEETSIRDPGVAKTKGDNHKRHARDIQNSQGNKCGICKGHGHNRLTCPGLNTTECQTEGVGVNVNDQFVDLNDLGGSPSHNDVSQLADEGIRFRHKHLSNEEELGDGYHLVWLPQL